MSPPDVAKGLTHCTFKPFSWLIFCLSHYHYCPNLTCLAGPNKRHSDGQTLLLLLKKDYFYTAFYKLIFLWYFSSSPFVHQHEYKDIILSHALHSLKTSITQLCPVLEYHGFCYSVPLVTSIYIVTNWIF